MDANFFHDTIPAEERAAADRLILLAEQMVLSIAIPHTVRRELDHPNTPLSAQRRANRLVYTLDTGLGDRSRLDKVRQVMQGNATPGRHHSDAAHLHDTAAWQAGYFVTCDGRILKKASEITAAIGDIWIVRPTELAAIFDKYEGTEQRAPAAPEDDGAAG